MLRPTIVKIKIVVMGSEPNAALPAVYRFVFWVVE